MNSRLLRQTLVNLLWCWLPMLLWMAWIFYLSAQPRLPRLNRRAGIGDNLFDYVAHAFTFGVLAVLVWRVWRARPTPLPVAWAEQAWLGTGVLTALYALSDELHQHFVPGRTAALADWLTDMAGAALALMLLWAWRRWQARGWAATVVNRLLVPYE
jgi:VanZ family protein